jgi:drug/metabolite transporter (DMT)-like permease
MGHSGEIAGIVTAFCWACASFLWTSIGKVSPFGVNGFKSVAGAARLTLVALAATGRAWPSLTTGQLSMLAGSGVVGLAAGDAFYFTAMLSMGPRRALLMGLCAAPMSAVLGWVALGERILWTGWAGMALTLSGIAVVQLEKTDDGERRAVARGVACGLFAASAQAVASAMNKGVLNAGVSAWHVPQVRLVAAALALALTGALLGRLREWAAPFAPRKAMLTALAATAMGTGIGLVLMTYSQKHASIGVSNTLTSTAPLFALPLAILVRKERVSARAWIGTAVAVGGVALMFVK